MARALTTPEEFREVLSAARRIAVLGAHPDPERAAHYVPAYLRSMGYSILPINAAYVGRTLFDEPVRARLDELAEPVDIVDVFRRADALDGHLDEILAASLCVRKGTHPRPLVVWLQTGIQNDAFAERCMTAGIDVAQNVCTMAAHRLLKLGPVPKCSH